MQRCVSFLGFWVFPRTGSGRRYGLQFGGVQGRQSAGCAILENLGVIRIISACCGVSFLLSALRFQLYAAAWWTSSFHT